MKVNLLWNNPQGVLSGWMNVDAYAQLDDPHGRTPCMPDSLSGIIDESEVTHLRAMGILDYYPWEVQPNRDSVLEHWASRIRKGGELTIGGKDLDWWVRSLSTGKITEEEFIKNVFAGRSASSMSEVVRWLKARGFTLLRCHSESGHYSVTARRE